MKNYKYEKGQYVEDSTRGKALVKPRSYKKDALVQAWVDRRKLAMLSVWLDEGGYKTRYMSDLIKYTIDEVVESLIVNKVVDKIEFTTDAVEIMKKYRADLNPGDRGLRNLHHNLVLDEMRKNKSFEYEVNQRATGDSLVERVRKQTEEDLEMLMDKKLEEQKKVALNDPRVVEVDDTPKIDVKRNVEKMKQTDDKIKEM
jgi:hypothetical protein